MKWRENCVQDPAVVEAVAELLLRKQTLAQLESLQQAFSHISCSVVQEIAGCS